MSTVFGTDSNSKTEELLFVMMKKLHAIDEKQDRMGEQLTGLAPLRDKVATLEEATNEIGAKQDTLAMVVECLDQAQLTLHNKLNRLETEQCAAHATRHPPGADASNDADAVPTSHKLEFPKFDGTDDPLAYSTGATDSSRCALHRTIRR
jgi:hypothetical protein